MLQRIYGTAFPKKSQLERHLEMLAEAEKRDHRKLGRELDLFSFRDVAPGFIFWHAERVSRFTGRSWISPAGCRRPEATRK